MRYAADYDHKEVVRVILEVDANVEVHNENSHTLLMEAASEGHFGVAKINTHQNEFKVKLINMT